MHTNEAIIKSLNQEKKNIFLILWNFLEAIKKLSKRRIELQV